MKWLALLVVPTEQCVLWKRSARRCYSGTMQRLFKKLSAAVTNLVTPRTPVEELTFRWKELQAVNSRILEVRKRMADLAADASGTAGSRLRDGSAIGETALWDQVKEHLEGILECLTAEQDLETGGGNQQPAPFGSPRRRALIGGGGGGAGSGQGSVVFQNFNDSLLEADDEPTSEQVGVGAGAGGHARPRSLTNYSTQVMAEHGPCLEYFLQQKIMETICVMGVRACLRTRSQPSAPACCLSSSTGSIAARPARASVTRLTYHRTATSFAYLPVPHCGCGVGLTACCSLRCRACAVSHPPHTCMTS